MDASLDLWRLPIGARSACGRRADHRWRRRLDHARGCGLQGGAALASLRRRQASTAAALGLSAAPGPGKLFGPQSLSILGAQRVPIFAAGSLLGPKSRGNAPHIVHDGSQSMVEDEVSPPGRVLALWARRTVCGLAVQAG